MSRIFISYKHNVDPDERLADYFVQQLTLQEHDVFIDKKIYLGDNWPDTIRQQIETSDFFIVLLSEFSVGSEMIIQEVSIAYSLKKQRGFPAIIPIRIAYTLPYTQMPYDLGAMLRSQQDTTWTKEGDEIEIAQKLNAVIKRSQPLLQEISMMDQNVDQLEKASALACDGNAILPDHQESPPLPAFDPQWLKELDMPGGAVRLESPFYVERHEDSEAKNQLLKDGVTIRIKGSRQIGKTSLLARLYQHASDNNYSIIYIDFQELDKNQFQDLDTLLHYLAYRIAADDQQMHANLDHYWQGPLGPKDKLTHFLSREILAPITQPLVLILDEVDRVFSWAAYRDDFFSLIRSWHNKRAIPGFQVWKKLNIVLTYSTEAFSFITDLNQSPFNVGMDFNLADFDRTQVEKLNHLHGEPVKTTQEMDDFMYLLQGHPFLVRKAFYILTCQSFTVDSLMQRAYDEDGPFSDHLHSYLWRLHQNHELCQEMKSVLENHSCSNDLLFYQLRSSGLVRGSNRANALPRCGLYANYFRKHL
jgi:hypothetical protein